LENAGYQSIGSFSGENIEYLTGLPDEEYVAPALPFAVDEPECQISCLHMGEQNNEWDKEFMLDRDQWTFLNHGAFGAALRCGHTRAKQWRDYVELQPLRFFDRDLLPHLAHSNRVLAEFIKAPPDATALIPNATSGLNSVLSGYAREFKGNIVLFDLAYGSVKKMARYYVGGDKVMEIPLTKKVLPILDENELVESFRQGLENIKRQKGNCALRDSMLVLDHVTSNTAIQMPIQSLAAIGKEEGMYVLVDGAHGLLSLDLDMRELHDSGVDFYVTNAHKWMSTVRGAAIMYCADLSLRESILRQPAIISHGIDDGYLSRFVWDGCRDYAAQLSIPTVVEFWKSKSPARVRKAMHELLLKSAKALVTTWHPGKSLDGQNVTIAPMSVHSSMCLIRLPDSLSGKKGDEKTSADAKRIQDFLHDNHRIEVPIKAIGGVLYVRISCHVYNKIEEYEKLAQAIMTLCQ